MVQSRIEGDIFIGNEADEHRGIMKLAYPMEHGMVTNWADMEKIWASLYEKNNLGVSSEEHPVLLTEAPLNPRRNREKSAEVFFETFGTPALFVSPQATLSLYSSGRTTGVVLDSGDGVTHAVPVYEGFSMPHAITRMDVAGRVSVTRYSQSIIIYSKSIDILKQKKKKLTYSYPSSIYLFIFTQDVTEYLQRLLRRAGYVFHTTAEREIVRNIKENVCYVAFNPIREEEIERDNNTEIKEYKLPDGKLIKIGPECFRAPEILFSPSIIGTEYGGVHQCLGNAIFKSDMDLRKKLFSDIVLAGGSTMFTGYGDRLLKEIKSLAQASQCAVCIYIYLYICHFYPFTLLHIILTIILNILYIFRMLKLKSAHHQIDNF